jgi:hypothetical protein
LLPCLHRHFYKAHVRLAVHAHTAYGRFVLLKHFWRKPRTLYWLALETWYSTHAHVVDTTTGCLADVPL